MFVYNIGDLLKKAGGIVRAAISAARIEDKDKEGEGLGPMASVHWQTLDAHTHTHTHTHNHTPCTLAQTNTCGGLCDTHTHTHTHTEEASTLSSKRYTCHTLLVSWSAQAKTDLRPALTRGRFLRRLRSFLTRS